MRKSTILALTFVVPFASPALAEPPADLDACIALSARTARAATAKITSEAEYVKYH